MSEAHFFMFRIMKGRTLEYVSSLCMVRYLVLGDPGIIQKLSALKLEFYSIFNVWNINVSRIVDPCPTTKMMNNISTHTIRIMIYLVFFMLLSHAPDPNFPPPPQPLSGTFYISLWTKALLEMTKPLSSLRDCNSVLNMMPQGDFLVTLYGKRDFEIGWPSDYYYQSHIWLVKHSLIVFLRAPSHKSGLSRHPGPKLFFAD